LPESDSNDTESLPGRMTGICCGSKDFRFRHVTKTDICSQYAAICVAGAGKTETGRSKKADNLPIIYAQCTDARSVTETSVTEPHPTSTSEQPQSAPQEPEKLKPADPKKPIIFRSSTHNVPMCVRLQTCL
jgi:hypothetical protein